MNRDFLAQARDGLFAQWAFRETPEETRLRCFQQEGKRWRLRPEYREWVRFEYHNLVNAVPPPGTDGEPFDLVVCRNVLIYFGQDAIARTSARFYESLAEGGWLLVGHAEPNEQVFRRFRMVVTPNGTLYQKQDAPRAAPELEIPVWRPVAIEERRPQKSITGRAVKLLPAVKESPPSEPARESAALVEARALADRGQQQAAAALCRKLIEANALDCLAHFTLGLVLEQSGCTEDAQEAFRRAVYLDRGFALAHYHLGACQQSMRNYTAARKAFRNVLQLLRDKPGDEILEYGDGISAGELSELTTLHIETTGESIGER